MSKKTWRESLRTGRQSTNIEDRRGFNGMGEGTTDRVMFDKSPMHTWGKDPENDRQAAMDRIRETLREYNQPMKKHGE